MSYLRFLCVFVCIYWRPAHTVLCFCFVCLRLVYPMLPILLDCQFLIGPAVFSNVYKIPDIHMDNTECSLLTDY